MDNKDIRFLQLIQQGELIYKAYIEAYDKKVITSGTKPCSSRKYKSLLKYLDIEHISDFSLALVKERKKIKNSLSSENLDISELKPKRTHDEIRRANLITLDTRTPEERKRIASMGGKKSQEVQKQRKMFKEILQTIINSPIKNPKKRKEIMDIFPNGEEITGAVAIAAAMFNQCMKGNVQATKAIVEMSGILDEENNSSYKPGADLSKEEKRMLSVIKFEDLEKVMNGDK